MEEWARSPIVHRSYGSPWSRCWSRMMTLDAANTSETALHTQEKRKNHADTRACFLLRTVDTLIIDQKWGKLTKLTWKTDRDVRELCRLNMSGKCWKYIWVYIRDGSIFAATGKLKKKKNKVWSGKNTSAMLVGFSGLPSCSALCWWGDTRHHSGLFNIKINSLTSSLCCIIWAVTIKYLNALTTHPLCQSKAILRWMI